MAYTYLINTSFFFGQLKVAQTSETTVATALQIFIDTLEPQYLKKLMGYELSKNYIAGISVVTPAQKWKDIRDGKEYTNRWGHLSKWPGLVFEDGTGKRSPIANYIYYYWMRKEASETSGKKEKDSDVPVVDNSPKQATAWNEMIAWNKELYDFMYVNKVTYGEFFGTWPWGRSDYDLFHTVNVLNV